MKNIIILLTAFLLASAAGMRATGADSTGLGSPREHLLLDESWKFHLGDDWPTALSLKKAGESGGPASENFDDATWRMINLPHDWAIELPFDKTSDKSHGFKALGPGFPKNNIGWYRRAFDVPASDAGRRIWLQFDGVFRDTTLWVNGWLVTRHEGGYYPFRADITDLVRFGGRNLIAVKVDASQFEGWFYEGAGIYRHVWLDKTSPVAIAPDGIFVTSHFENNLPSDKVQIGIEASLVNTLDSNANTMISQEIVSPEGRSVAKSEEQAEIPSNGTSEIKSSIGLNTPVLWSLESPKLYHLVTTVTMDGKVVDQKKTEFGIRTIAFDKDKGFLLNGKSCWLKGTCNHQDHAGVGAALPDALQYFRISRLKEMGCNAYRTSHNPPTPELLDACDRLGMLVMDENRLLGSDEQNLGKLETQVRRDRNHPSVVIWSLANEEFAVQVTPQAANVARTMQALVKRLDSTRPVTYAAPQGDTFAGINSVIEVRGWNYNVGGDMDRYHAEHPDQPNVGTETASYVGTRGIYEDDKQRGYVKDYMSHAADAKAATWWSYYAERPWLSGGFAWTGFDYRGEPTPYGWPCVNSHFGILDTCGFPKDDFYYYKSWWTSEPVLHLLPHWNWPGKEGQEILATAMSNCEEVELFLNGSSLGKRQMKRNGRLSWSVKYAPGTLSAKGFNGGKLVADTKVETTGDPAAITLAPDRSSIRADGEDLSIVTVAVTDTNGRIVPTAGNSIHFALSGPGKIIGVGNGDPSCHEPDTFIVPAPVMTEVALKDWRWKMAPVSGDGASSPEIDPSFDDKGWDKIPPNTDESGIRATEAVKGNQSDIFRTHVTLTDADLSNFPSQVLFQAIYGESRVFVNGRPVGSASGITPHVLFEFKKLLHAGDNVVVMLVGPSVHWGYRGGLNPNVTLKLCHDNPEQPAWRRSIFNGLAQIIVQSTKQEGKITLTATADGLKPLTTEIDTQPSVPRPAIP